MHIFWLYFQNPEFFLLFVLVPILILIEFIRKKFGIKFKDISLLYKIYSTNSIKFYLELFLKILILSLFIIIIANPGITNVKKEESKKWIDISIVLDISKSMLAEDIGPNRIEAAKKVINSFISKLETDRLAIVIFAWKPFVSVPLTFDYVSLINFIQNLTTDTINQNIPWMSGTAIGDAIIVAADGLDKWSNDLQNKNREKVIILITDWEANVWLNPKIATKYVQEKNIKIFTIWIWSKVGSPLFVTNNLWIKEYFRDNFWNPIMAKLDEETLKFIASNTGWKYFNVNSSDTLTQVFDELSKLNKTEVKTEVIKEFNQKYQIFLIFLIFSILVLLWTKVKYRVLD